MWRCPSGEHHPEWRFLVIPAPCIGRNYRQRANRHARNPRGFIREIKQKQRFQRALLRRLSTARLRRQSLASHDPPLACRISNRSDYTDFIHYNWAYHYSDSSDSGTNFRQYKRGRISAPHDQ